MSTSFTSPAPLTVPLLETFNNIGRLQETCKALLQLCEGITTASPTSTFSAQRKLHSVPLFSEPGVQEVLKKMREKMKLAESLKPLEEELRKIRVEEPVDALPDSSSDMDADDLFQLESHLLCAKTLDAAVLLKELKGTSESVPSFEGGTAFHFHETVLFQQLLQRLRSEAVALGAESLQCMLQESSSLEEATDVRSPSPNRTLADGFTSPMCNASDAHKEGNALVSSMIDFVLCEEQLEDSAVPESDGVSTRWMRRAEYLQRRITCIRMKYSQDGLNLPPNDARVCLSPLLDALGQWTEESSEAVKQISRRARACLALIFTVTVLMLEVTLPQCLSEIPQKRTEESSTITPDSPSPLRADNESLKGKYLTGPATVNALCEKMTEALIQVCASSNNSQLPLNPSSAVTWTSDATLLELWNTVEEEPRETHNSTSGGNLFLRLASGKRQSVCTAKRLTALSTVVSSWRSRDRSREKAGRPGVLPSDLLEGEETLPGISLLTKEHKGGSKAMMFRRRRVQFVQRALCASAVLPSRVAWHSSRMTSSQVGGNASRNSKVPATADEWESTMDAASQRVLATWLGDKFLQGFYAPLLRWYLHVAECGVIATDETTQSAPRNALPKSLLLLYRVASVPPMRKSFILGTTTAAVSEATGLYQVAQEGLKRVQETVKMGVSGALEKWMKSYMKKATEMTEEVLQRIMDEESSMVESVEGPRNSPLAVTDEALDGYQRRGEWISKMYYTLLHNGTESSEANEKDPSSCSKSRSSTQIDKGRTVSFETAQHWLHCASWSRSLPLFQYFLFQSQCVATQDHERETKFSAASSSVRLMLREIVSMLRRVVRLSYALPRFLGQQDEQSKVATDVFTQGYWGNTIAEWLTQTTNVLLHNTKKLEEEFQRYTTQHSSSLGLWSRSRHASRAYDLCVVLHSFGFISLLFQEEAERTSVAHDSANQRTSHASNSCVSETVSQARARLERASTALAEKGWQPVLCDILQHVLLEALGSTPPCDPGEAFVASRSHLFEASADGGDKNLRPLPTPPAPRTPSFQNAYNKSLLMEHVKRVGADRSAPSPPVMNSVTATTEQILYQDPQNPTSPQDRCVEGEVRASVWVLTSELVRVVHRLEHSVATLFTSPEASSGYSRASGFKGASKNLQEEIPEDHQLLRELLQSTPGFSSSLRLRLQQLNSVTDGNPSDSDDLDALRTFQEPSRKFSSDLMYADHQTELSHWKAYILENYMYPTLVQWLMEAVNCAFKVFGEITNPPNPGSFTKEDGEIARKTGLTTLPVEGEWQQRLLDICFVQKACECSASVALSSWSVLRAQKVGQGQWCSESHDTAIEQGRLLMRNTMTCFETYQPHDSSLGFHHANSARSTNINPLEWRAESRLVMAHAAKKVEASALSLGLWAAATSLTASKERSEDSSSEAKRSSGARQVHRFLPLPLVSDEPEARFGSGAAPPPTSSASSGTSLRSYCSSDFRQRSRILHSVTATSVAAKERLQRAKGLTSFTLQNTFSKINPLGLGRHLVPAPAEEGSRTATPSAGISQVTQEEPSLRIEGAASMITNVWSSLWGPSSGSPMPAAASAAAETRNSSEVANHTTGGQGNPRAGYGKSGGNV